MDEKANGDIVFSKWWWFSLIGLLAVLAVVILVKPVRMLIGGIFGRLGKAVDK